MLTAALNVLIVEDDRYMNEMLGELLSDKGFDVESSFDGNDAIDTISNSKKKFGLVILDYNLKTLQRSNGIDVFEAAKKLNPDLKAIMISGYGNNIIKNKAASKGIDVYMDKPFLINDFLSEVGRLTDNKYN